MTMVAKKILLIDDEEDILEILSYNLKKEGYEVHTATDGTSGIEKAKEILPIVDINQVISLCILNLEHKIKEKLAYLKSLDEQAQSGKS